MTAHDGGTIPPAHRTPRGSHPPSRSPPDDPAARLPRRPDAVRRRSTRPWRCTATCSGRAVRRGAGGGLVPGERRERRSTSTGRARTITSSSGRRRSSGSSSTTSTRPDRRWRRPGSRSSANRSGPATRPGTTTSARTATSTRSWAASRGRVTMAVQTPLTAADAPPLGRAARRRPRGLGPAVRGRRAGRVRRRAAPRRSRRRRSSSPASASGSSAAGRSASTARPRRRRPSRPASPRSGSPRRRALRRQQHVEHRRAGRRRSRRRSSATAGRTPAAHWLKTLIGLERTRLWWARTGAVEEYEDALFGAFAEAIPPDERARLHDATRVLPFANLRRPPASARRRGLAGQPAAPSRAGPVDVCRRASRAGRLRRRGRGRDDAACAPGAIGTRARARVRAGCSRPPAARARRPRRPPAAARPTARPTTPRTCRPRASPGSARST